MERLNQQIANILGDFKEERDPAEDPSPTRAGCRIFFVVSLLLGFSLLLVYNFNVAPDTRVVQMSNLTPGDKNHAFPSCFLYDRNSSECKKWSTTRFRPGIPVSCPCTNTSVSWGDFVKFYLLFENSTAWNMSFTVESLPGYSPQITLPDDTIRLGNENIVKDKEILTAEKFCNVSYLWPFANSSTSSPGMVLYVPEKFTVYPEWRRHCLWMATLLFPGPEDYEDRTRSTQFLNTPSLLNREGLHTLVAQLARESVLARRLGLDMATVGVDDETSLMFRRFYNALASLLIGLLDRAEMDPSQSYVYGALDISTTLNSTHVYDDDAVVWYLGDETHDSPIFLHPEIDWEAYREACFPMYCEVTKSMRDARRLYWAFGILGGVATIIFHVVKKLLWPCTVKLLLWISKPTAAAVEDPEGPMLHDPSSLQDLWT